MKQLVTILIPAYNESEVIDPLYTRLSTLRKNSPKYRFEYLFVNDGSIDDTLERIETLARDDTSISYVDLSRNFGKEIAMIAGFDHARGDAVVVIDADLQDPPELIPTMLKHWEEGYDDVYATRRSRKGESWFKKKTSTLFYSLLERSTDVPIQRDTGDFRLLSRRAVDALKEFR